MSSGAVPSVDSTSLSPRHVSKSLENIQVESQNGGKSAEKDTIPDVGHRRSHSQSIGSEHVTSFQRSLSHQPEYERGRTDAKHDDLAKVDFCFRLVIVSSKVRTISSLKHALLPGVTLVHYNSDTQNLSDLQVQVEQILKGKKIASVALILSCTGPNLQLVAKEDKTLSKDGSMDPVVEEFFTTLVKKHFISADRSCRIDFLCWYGLQNNDLNMPVVARLEAVTGVVVSAWKDLSGTAPRRLEDAMSKPVGELYFRLEKLRNWSGRHQQSLAGFEKIRTVGKGAYGAAVLYKKKDDESLVILKEINLHDLNVSERQMALNEVSVLAMLDHPNIISYYDSFEEDGVLMIEMEYADNGTLAQFLSKQVQPLDERDILAMFQQIVAAIRHIHTHNILHRDLKTDNIFLTKEGVVKVGDFGISKMMSSANKGAQTVLGTPYYISPEMCEGKEYSFKSDIWALGCILYEMACLQKTFEGSNLPALVNKIMKGQFTPVKGNYSEDFKVLVTQMLNKDPEARPEANSIMYQLLPSLMHKAGEKKSDIEEDSNSSESLNKKLRSVLYYLEASTGTLTCIDNLPPRMRIKHMGVGPDHVVVTTSERQVFTWGFGGFGQLGHGDTQDRAYPMLVDALKGKSISLVCCGLGFSVFGSDNGLVLTCGDGSSGCLGHGDWCGCTRPRLVESLLSVDVRAMACGLRHVVVLGRGGEVMSWGDGSWGQLGLGSESSQCLPCAMQIAEPVVFTDVQCGIDGTMLISDDGGVFACGRNEYNKLGLNNRQGFLMAMKNIFTKTEVDGKNVPTPVRALARHIVVSISMGSQHTAVIVEPGHVITFGRNSEAQLGAQSTKALSSMVEVKPLQEECVCRVQCGDHYTVATTKTHQLYYWGLRYTTPSWTRYEEMYHARQEAQASATRNQTVDNAPYNNGQQGGDCNNDSAISNAEKPREGQNDEPQNERSPANDDCKKAGPTEARSDVRGFRPLSSLPQRSLSASSQEKDSVREDSVIVSSPTELMKLKQGNEKMLLGNVYCHGENIFVQLETTAPPPRRKTFKKRVLRRKSTHPASVDRGENSSEASELDNGSAIPTWLKEELAQSVSRVNDGNEADNTSGDSDNPAIDSSLSSIQINRAMTPVSSEVTQVFVSPRIHQRRDRTSSLNSSESLTDPPHHFSDSSSGEVTTTKLPDPTKSNSKPLLPKSQPRGKLASKTKAKPQPSPRGSSIALQREERLLFQLERMKEEKKAADARVRLLERERENHENLIREKAAQLARERETSLKSEVEQLRQEISLQNSLLSDRQRMVSELQSQLETLQKQNSISATSTNSTGENLKSDSQSRVECTEAQRETDGDSCTSNNGDTPTPRAAGGSSLSLSRKSSSRVCVLQ